MGELVLSRQGEKLLEFYTQMAEEAMPEQMVIMWKLLSVILRSVSSDM